MKCGQRMAILGIGLMFLLTAFGCAKHIGTASQSIDSKPKEVTQIPQAIESAPAVQNPAVSERSAEGGKPGSGKQGGGLSLKDIYFDFDRSVISPEMKDVLNSDVSYLRTKRWDKMKIEGYCDTRGTNEYNLVLGNKRAHAVKTYLVSVGMDGKRISTISYGKERPVCTEPNEECFKLNRRAHFNLQE